MHIIKGGFEALHPYCDLQSVVSSHLNNNSAVVRSDSSKPLGSSSPVHISH